MSKKCSSCKGTGMLKSAVTTCPNCKGKKCSECPIRESGFATLSYTECPLCLGTGSGNEALILSVVGLKPSSQAQLSNGGLPLQE